MRVRTCPRHHSLPRARRSRRSESRGKTASARPAQATQGRSQPSVAPPASRTAVRASSAHLREQCRMAEQCRVAGKKWVMFPGSPVLHRRGDVSGTSPYFIRYVSGTSPYSTGEDVSGTSPYYTREGCFRNFTVLHQRGDVSGTSPYSTRERCFRNFTVLHERGDVSGTSPYYIGEGKRRASAQTYPKVERVKWTRCSPLLAPNMRHQRLFEGPIARARPDPQTSP